MSTVSKNLESALFLLLIIGYNVCMRWNMEVLKNVSIKPYTSMKVGGNVKEIFFPEDTDDILDVLNKCKDVIVIGNCSNLIIPDGYYDKSFMILRDNFSKIRKDGYRIIAESGVTMKALSRFALKSYLKGFEFLDGIPGTIGGGIFMNAGAYGPVISDVLESVSAVRDGKVVRYTKEQLDFSQRYSSFQTNGEIIVGATFIGEEGDQKEIEAVINDLNGRRREKQPLDYPSCGSVFKRPENGFASKIIDECGLKGLRIGGAEVSKKHAGFIINVDNASYEDVVLLIQKVHDIVLDKTGISLETEVKILR